jgi:hypothetical protein
MMDYDEYITDYSHLRVNDYLKMVKHRDLQRLRHSELMAEIVNLHWRIHFFQVKLKKLDLKPNQETPHTSPTSSSLISP